MLSRTFNKLATVDFAGCDLKRDNVTLNVVSATIGCELAVKHTAASLRSLIGIPIVLVMTAFYVLCRISGLWCACRRGRRKCVVVWSQSSVKSIAIAVERAVPGLEAVSSQVSIEGYSRVREIASDVVAGRRRVRASRFHER